MTRAIGVCSIGGDSAGPVVFQDLRGATGVVSGGNGCPAGALPDGQVSQNPANQFFFEPIQRFVDTWGIAPYGG